MRSEKLAEAQDLFIRRWGEMAASWGISRTMAEIHALLYLAPEPLCADDVMEMLAVSRGSASMNLRELINWGLVRRLHRRGDRKDYYAAETDVWTMFETISRERRRREVQPIVETIERCLEMIDEGKTNGKSSESARELAACRQRFENILEFCNLMNSLFNVVMKANHLGAGAMMQRLRKVVTS